LNAVDKTRGLTLVEMLVALLILGLTVGISLYVVNAFRFNRNALRETEALNFARAYVDATRGLWKEDSLYVTGVLPNLKLPPKFTLTVQVKDEAVVSGTLLTWSPAVCANTGTVSVNTTAPVDGSIPIGTTGTGGCGLVGAQNSTAVAATAGVSAFTRYSTSLLNPNPRMRSLSVTVADNTLTGVAPKAKLDVLVLRPKT
jgi:prepilin-type N-terminal cleavage/methylation domain-containing protein